MNTPEDAGLAPEHLDLWAKLSPENQQRVMRILVQLAMKATTTHAPVVEQTPRNPPSANTNLEP